MNNCPNSVQVTQSIMVDAHPTIARVTIAGVTLMHKIIWKVTEGG